MHERFGAKGKALVCLEQSRGALIYQLMAYELFELYPINPSLFAHYRKTFFSSGAKDDFPYSYLLILLLFFHLYLLLSFYSLLSSYPLTFYSFTYSFSTPSIFLLIFPILSIFISISTFLFPSLYSFFLLQVSSP